MTFIPLEQDKTIRAVAIAICKSATCEGANCCQWPANTGRTGCNAKAGAYDDAAKAAMRALANETSFAGRLGEDRIQHEEKMRATKAVKEAVIAFQKVYSATQ